MVINSFLGRKDVVEILLSNEKTDVLLKPTMKRLIRWFGAISLSLFGYPQTLISRSRAEDLFKMMSVIPQGSLVDIGCSFGAAHTFELARRLAPHPVLGIDIDQVNIDVAKRLNQVLSFDNLSFEVGDILLGDPRNRLFDIAFTSETLEHLQDDVLALKNISRMVKPRGWLVISVPYSEVSVEFDVPEAAFETQHDSDTSDLFKGGYHWRSGYNEERLRTLLDAVGFEMISVIYTKSRPIISSNPALFPVAYLLSKLTSPFGGTPKKINILARRLTM